MLYTAWGQFITPAVMGLPAAAMPIIWVAFSGRADLTATLVGTFVLLLSFQALTVYSQQYALILMGALLLVTVLFVPAGFVAGLSQRLRRRRPCASRRGRGEAACRDARCSRPRPAQALRRAATCSRRRLRRSTAGEIHCLIGPNGAGKSTLFKLMVGTYEPSAGKVLFRGEDVTAAQAVRARRPRHEHQDAGAERLSRAAGRCRTS